MTVYWKKGEGTFFNWKDGETIDDIILFLSKDKQKDAIVSIELTPEEVEIFWNLDNEKKLLTWLKKKRFKDKRFKEFFEHLFIRKNIIDLWKAGAIKAEKKNGKFLYSPTKLSEEVFKKRFKKEYEKERGIEKENKEELV